MAFTKPFDMDMIVGDPTMTQNVDLVMDNDCDTVITTSIDDRIDFTNKLTIEATIIRKAKNCLSYKTLAPGFTSPTIIDHDGCIYFMKNGYSCMIETTREIIRWNGKMRPEYEFSYGFLDDSTSDLIQWVGKPNIARGGRFRVHGEEVSFMFHILADNSRTQSVSAVLISMQGLISEFSGFTADHLLKECMQEVANGN